MSQKISNGLMNTLSDAAVNRGKRRFAEAQRYQGLMIDLRMPRCPECGAEIGLEYYPTPLQTTEPPIVHFIAIQQRLMCPEHGQLTSPMNEFVNSQTIEKTMKRRVDELPVSALPKGVSA